MTANALSLKLHVSYPRVYEILSGTRIITVDTALRLSKLFGTEPQYWLSLQVEYDLSRFPAQMANVIEQEVQPLRSMNKAKKTTTGVPITGAALHLKDNEKKVYSVLTDEPVDFDLLLSKTGMNVRVLSASLGMLELSGLVRRLPGDNYFKIPTIGKRF